MALKRKITIAGAEYTISFGLKERRDFERATKLPLWPDGLTSDQIDIQAALLWSALHNNAQIGPDPDDTAKGIDAAFALIEAHVEPEDSSLADVLNPVVMLAIESRCFPFKAEWVAKMRTRLVTVPKAIVPN